MGVCVSVTCGGRISAPGLGGGWITWREPAGRVSTHPHPQGGCRHPSPAQGPGRPKGPSRLDGTPGLVPPHHLELLEQSRMWGPEVSTQGTRSGELLNQREQAASPQMPAWVPGPPETHHSLRPDAQNPASEFYNSHLGACPVLQALEEEAGGGRCPGPHYLCDKSCGNSQHPEEQIHGGPQRCRPRFGTSSGKTSGFPVPTGFKGSR